MTTNKHARRPPRGRSGCQFDQRVSEKRKQITVGGPTAASAAAAAASSSADDPTAGVGKRQKKDEDA